MTGSNRRAVTAVINPKSTAMTEAGDEVHITFKFKSADAAQAAFDILLRGFQAATLVIDLPEVEERWETKGVVN